MAVLILWNFECLVPFSSNFHLQSIILMNLIYDLQSGSAVYFIIPFQLRSGFCFVIDAIKLLAIFEPNTVSVLIAWFRAIEQTYLVMDLGTVHCPLQQPVNCSWNILLLEFDHCYEQKTACFHCSNCYMYDTKASFCRKHKLNGFFLRFPVLLVTPFGVQQKLKQYSAYESSREVSDQIEFWKYFKPFTFYDWTVWIFTVCIFYVNE